MGIPLVAEPILAPLPNIAVHVVQAKRIWPFGGDSSRSELIGVFVVPGEVGQLLGVVAKGIVGGRTGATGKLPLCFGG